MDVPRTVQEWVDDVRGVLQPARVHWCDGSEAEREALEREAVASGVLMPLALPGRFDPLADFLAGFTRSRPIEVGESDGRDLDVQVDPVQQRAGNATQIGKDLPGAGA